MDNKLRLLLIDDSTERRDAIINHFDKQYNHSIDITIVKNVNQAIEIEKKYKFDLIILDLNLPYDNDGPNNFGGKTFIDDSDGIKNKLIYLTSTEKTKQNNLITNKNRNLYINSPSKLPIIVHYKAFKKYFYK